MNEAIRIGTRASRLARAQSEIVAACLRELGLQVVLRPMRTSGDRRRDLALPPEGAFVHEIERSLRDGDVDLAVHSMKDLPTGSHDGLVIAAVPLREDPRDALVSRARQVLSELPSGSRVGTSSRRRVAMVRGHRPDLTFLPLRGNVDTRLRKLEDGSLDAVIVAQAGLVRLDMAERASECLPPEVCMPAPGQGALALQVRASDEDLLGLLARLDHPPSRLAVSAERAFLAGLGVGCNVPAGALGLVEDEQIRLEAAIADPEGASILRREVHGPAEDGEGLARQLAEDMLAEGAAKLIADIEC